jgi:hypothetical protein
MAELSFDVDWDGLTDAEKLAFAGWASYFEGVIGGWVDLGAGDPRPAIEVLADAARRLGVRGV